MLNVSLNKIFPSFYICKMLVNNDFARNLLVTLKKAHTTWAWPFPTCLHVISQLQEQAGTH